MAKRRVTNAERWNKYMDSVVNRRYSNRGAARKAYNKLMAADKPEGLRLLNFWYPTGAVMEEQKYWYRCSLDYMYVGGKRGITLEPNLEVSFPTVPVVHEDENIVVLGTETKLNGEVIETVDVVKALNRGPYYPTKREAATALLLSKLHEIESLEQDIQSARCECKELLKLSSR